MERHEKCVVAVYAREAAALERAEAAARRKQAGLWLQVAGAARLYERLRRKLEYHRSFQALALTLTTNH